MKAFQLREACGMGGLVLHKDLDRPAITYFAIGLKKCTA